ncbi:MAG: hypothetical protein GY928_03900 [Colwellia sp.]|nr:hypothetical protein [Colwellia sp.]
MFNRKPKKTQEQLNTEDMLLASVASWEKADHVLFAKMSRYLQAQTVLKERLHDKRVNSLTVHSNRLELDIFGCMKITDIDEEILRMYND